MCTCQNFGWNPAQRANEINGLCEVERLKPGNVLCRAKRMIDSDVSMRRPVPIRGTEMRLPRTLMHLASTDVPAYGRGIEVPAVPGML